MNTKLLKQDAIEINEMLFSLLESRKDDVSLEQTMVDFYNSQFPGALPGYAQAVVDKIKEGVTNFNNSLNEALKSEEVDYVAKLKALGEGKTNEEQYELYINFLSALTTLTVTNFSDENGETIESFDEIKNKIIKVKGSVTDEELEDVIRKVVDALENDTFAMSSAKMINKLIEILPQEELKGVEEIIRGSEEDVKNKMILSLATYIMYHKGELKSYEGTDLTPDQIALSVCMRIEEAHILADVKKGILTVENAIALFKKMILFALDLISILLVAVSSEMIVIGLVSIFSSSPILAVLLFVSLLFLMYKFLFKAAMGYGKARAWLEDSIDLAIEKWQDEIWPAIKNKVTEIIEWIKTLLSENKIEITEATTTVGQTDDTIVDEIVVNNTEEETLATTLII